MTVIRTRALIDSEARAAEPGTPLRFIIASAGTKRDGLDLDMTRFALDNFNRNPVMLWMHGKEPARGSLPIGRWANLARDGRAITGDAIFDQADDFARDVERKYRDGYLNAVSVSWLPEEARDGYRYDMLEASAVSVPADPDAVQVGRDFAESILDFEGARFAEEHSLPKSFAIQLLREAAEDRVASISANPPAVVSLGPELTTKSLEAIAERVARFLAAAYSNKPRP